MVKNFLLEVKCQNMCILIIIELGTIRKSPTIKKKKNNWKYLSISFVSSKFDSDSKIVIIFVPASIIFWLLFC